MKITIDGSEWAKEVQFVSTFADKALNAAKAPVLQESEQAEAKVKAAMPVDTGRARTGWGRYTPYLMVYDDPGNPSSPADSVWEVENDGLAIVQGTEVPYTPRLNEGSSMQAPAGFIDSIGLMALEQLENSVGAAIEQAWVNG